MIAVSGGGTGGHFFPALAFTNYVLKKEKVKFIGSKRGIEYELKDLIKTEKLFLDVEPLRERNFYQKLKAIWKFLKAQEEINEFLKEDYRALIFGGYASLPLGINTVLRRKELFIHEQNSIPSKTNKILSKKAKKVLITFNYTKRFFPEGVRVGLPIRKELKKKLPKKEVKKRFGLEPDKITVLIFGGSQGALFLNELARDLKSVLPKEFQVILLTGKIHYEKFKNLEGEKFRVMPFSLDMGLIYSASDVAISRAGAGTINELSHFGVPSVFVPYPYAVDDHQFYNAKEIEKLGGGLVLRQEEAKPDKVLSALKEIVKNLERYSENIKKFFAEGAEERMYEELLG
ncbi:undecaprenyldiphospho-muramoylpentapeptide beta-N-acetylglucosaminyltransferase [Aquifex aeolicus]|uniref:UDP-N-acetylglucosamine--N-acetylmuramyl-(pentapeptide) pyrophosphoryl-undecaprenol N-acetylglucosamine transferase n=1 Tax=Aquifex aeolicus (strain VF5) TaxID=224324 RepID=MURG_AQUAE|nr:undecaprenyldiphospho-muramoylpentapeptide beta-N-acetylglucosaminyltransferase [Aquifex aeolicus]O67238.1 RecName: Full=UDP-N-acetylglucosamine--N-acetylmuramyl-(pentapeptide) pyrophosphoryl-undecaprenol N-acetylglucosamine transferase; AltName: Full=Undecaprenyl-PP-MurNAc-pentapeptide-UDPGlcNAc GlcNAc transferase [Aquifex aeolicus VF5]AAC07193.1 phospho-N-acetylmuramoyl-pentapeptide-transferase [Aquifex aeolicus VF5]